MRRLFPPAQQSCRVFATLQGRADLRHDECSAVKDDGHVLPLHGSAMNERSHIQTLSDRVLRQRESVRAADADVERDDAPRARVPGLVANRYRLGARIGRWQLGEVYEAVDESIRDLNVERQVAVQVLDDKYAADRLYVDELRRGYAALRAGSHPCLVEVLEFGRDSKTFYLVMERLDGASLRFVLDDAGALPFDEAAGVIRAVGDGLQYLHAKSLVHGNVKPESVFVTYDYGVKLLDIVTASRPSVVPYYVEDIETQTPAARDVRDDVYGLACLSYELLSGRHPFNANSPLEAHRAHMQPAPLDVLSHRQWLALEGALALERDERTPTVVEFLDELGIKGTERLRAQAPGDTAEAAAEPFTPRRQEPRLDAGYDDEPGAEPDYARTPARARAPAHARAPAPEYAPPRRAAPAAGRVHAMRGDYVDDDTGGPWRTAPRKSGSTGTPIALVLVAALGAVAYFYYAPLREGTTQLIATLDAERRAWLGEPSQDEAAAGARAVPEPVAGERVASSLDAGAPSAAAPADPAQSAADRSDTAPPDVPPRAQAGAQTPGAPPPETRTPPVRTLPATPPSAVAGVETPAAIAPAGEDATTSDPAEAPAGAAAETQPPERAVDARGTEPSASSAGNPPAAGEPAGPSAQIAAAATATPDPAAPPAATTFAFAGQTVRVGEAEVAALVPVTRTGDLSTTPDIVWWTADDTAIADEDYANLGQNTETFATGEPMLSLYVPLVRDTIPERNESFFVYIGRFDAERRHLEATASVRVEIVDDD